MQAIIKTGGKQYLVEQGSRIKVESLPYSVGEEFSLEEVLLLSSEKECKVGTPNIKGAKVLAKVEKNGRMPKIIVYKKKRRKGYKKTQGHRQNYTQLLIQKIEI